MNGNALLFGGYAHDLHAEDKSQNLRTLFYKRVTTTVLLMSHIRRELIGAGNFLLNKRNSIASA